MALAAAFEYRRDNGQARSFAAITLDGLDRFLRRKQLLWIAAAEPPRRWTGVLT